MFKTIDRYVIREILPPLFLSLLVYTFILEIPPVMTELESLVAKGVSWGAAFRILLTLIPQGLGLTIPMALLTGLLIGLGRMSGDREAVALLACGVSPYRLLRPVLALTVLAAAANLYVMIDAIPNANQAYREIIYEIVSQKVESDVQPQVFFNDFPGWEIYTRDIPKDRTGWKDVLVAQTEKSNAMEVYFAASGRLHMDSKKQIVELILNHGTRYSSSGQDGRQVETFWFPDDLTVQLDPKTIFPRINDLQRGLAEMTIAELRDQAKQKVAGGLPPHQEIIYTQQKFSFPFACLVFAVIGLALGLTVARDGKLAGFVVGIGVIFVYYVLLYVTDAVARGYYGNVGIHGTILVATLARWVPNIVLLPFGVAALIWRARWAEGRVPFRSTVRLATAVTSWVNQRRERAAAAAASASLPSGSSGRGRPVVVVRIPRFRWRFPSILDRYVSVIYLRATGLSFVALLGMFYISTFIDRSDKLFKGHATTGMMMRLLGLMTPQFVYYIIPLAALLSVLVTFGVLSRTSELSVMKACGISLYRVALPLMVLAVAWSGVLYGLEQQILARANQRADALDAQIRGRPPHLSNPLDRRWLVGTKGDIYHYSYFDPIGKRLDDLVIYRPATHGWELAGETFTPEARYVRGQWIAHSGWARDFRSTDATWTTFASRPIALEPPTYFGAQEPLPEMMTVPELKRHIEELSASGFNVAGLSVDLQRKLAFPCVTIVMTLLAIPFGLTTGKRGTLYGIGIAIVLALTYWVVGNAFDAIGKSGLLGPVMAGWAPNLLAAGSAAYLLLTTRT